jgi:hypothetical protein
MKTVAYVTSDPAYYSLEKILSKAVAEVKGPIFRTNVEGLFDKFLDNLPSDRQHYTCKCCRLFVEKYGGLVQINDEGLLMPILWNGEYPGFFQNAASEMWSAVAKSSVTSIFINAENTWGKPQTGDWTHMHAFPTFVHEHPTKTAFQLEAEKTQDFGILKHGLHDYPIVLAAQALRILEAPDALPSAVKCLGVAKWFHDIHQKLVAIRNQRHRDHIIWSAVATAPPGWCHVRSSMISTLLDDLKAGKSFDEIKRGWTKKIQPDQYMRPQAPPSDAAIAAAEKIFQKLEAAGSLARRFARIEETVRYWNPVAEFKGANPAATGVFQHLKSQPTNPCKDIELPPVTMTWARFRAEVLPHALEISVRAPSRGSYYGLVTAVNMDAPPIIQWDGNPRNPVTWFLFKNGSSARQWSLPALQWVAVNGIMENPCHWYHENSHHERAALLILEGCKMPEDHVGGGSLFPVHMRAEYHEHRRVIEAYSERATITGATEGTANGLALQAGNHYSCQLRVKDTGGVSYYNIDRWN